MSATPNFKAARAKGAHYSEIPGSSTSNLMYYLKSVRVLLKDKSIADWAIDYKHHHLNDSQFLQLIAWVDDYNLKKMNEKYLFIEVPALPKGKNNMFLDTRNRAACGAVPEELTWKIEKANSNYVMIFTHGWIKKHYKKPIKKALERHHRIIQSRNQIDDSGSLLGESAQTFSRDCEVA
jgi:hypothetical protein